MTALSTATAAERWSFGGGGGMASDDTPNGQRPARWNVVSVWTPFMGFLAGLFVGICGNGFLGMDGVFWGFRVWFGFCCFGFIAAVIALAREERPWGVTALGFILNLPLIGLSSLFLGGR